MKHHTFAALLLAGTVLSFPAAAATVIDLNNPVNASRTTWSVAPGTDVTVIGSTTARDRQISIQNARNVEVRGGVWKPTIREYDGTIHTKDITGSVTITGATIDNSAVRGADGVIVNANGKTKIPFLMTNSTITGIRGKQGGDHADGVQPQGEVSTFRMENVRIDTDYQGLMLADQPNINYGGKVDSISLTDVSIQKLGGGEAGCRYPIIVGGNQSVKLDNVTTYSQGGCRGNGILNVDNRAKVDGQVTYGNDQTVDGAQAGTDETAYAGSGGGGSGDGDQYGGMRPTLASSGDFMCSGSFASLALAAVDGVISMLGGGRASQLAQGLQIKEAVVANFCAASMNDRLNDQLAEQRRMTAGIGRNAVGSAGGVSGGVRDTLRLSQPEATRQFYQDGASADLTAKDSLAYHENLRIRTDAARRNALETAEKNAAAEKIYSKMADDALALSQSAQGQTSAQQAQTQMDRAREGAASARTSTALAFDHARLMTEEEERAGERMGVQRRNRLYRSEPGDAAQPFKLFQ